MTKRRSLVTGKFYKSIQDVRRAEKMRAFRREVSTPEEMKALSDKAQTPEAKEKKSKSLKLYFKKNPGEFSRRIKMAYEKNPELRTQRANVLRVTRTDMENYYTDPENAEKRRTSKDGKQVIQYIEGVRQQSTGVVVEDD